MRRDEIPLSSWAIGDANLIAYGHYGRPMVWFPSDAGRAVDFENNGLLDAVRHLIDDGRVKVYAVASYDNASWRRDDIPTEERALANQRYEDFLVNDVVPFIYDDCGGPADILLNGQSFGAYHAANFCLRRADLFPAAICMSGVYDMAKIGWGKRGDAFYFNNPMDYVPNMSGDHLDWIRSRVLISLVCGRGPWEDDSASGSLPSTLRFNDVLGSTGIPHELDLWGHDSAHDWPWWCKQLAHHLPRFC